MDEPVTNAPSAHPRLRTAINRALARRAAAAPPVLGDAPDSAPDEAVFNPSVALEDAPAARLMRQARFRTAASRATARHRNGVSLAEQPDGMVPSDGAARRRSRARPRTRDHEMTAATATQVAQPFAHVAPSATQRHPAAFAESLQPDDIALAELRRPPLWLAFLVGVGWAAMLVWLMLGSSGPHTQPRPRLIFGGALLVLNLLTWAPLQWATRLPVLTWRGTVGWSMLLWTLAFVPVPTQKLVAGLPDVPVYLLFFGGLFLASNAVALPLLYVWGLRRYQNRLERFDVRRSQRQAAEVGVFVAMCAVFATLNILEPVTVTLLSAILVLSEMVVLSLKR